MFCYCVTRIGNLIKVIKLTFVIVAFMMFFNLWIEPIIDFLPNGIQEIHRPSDEDTSLLIASIIEDKYNSTMSNKSNLLSSDRNLVIVITEGTTLDTFIRYILLLHPQVIYLGSLTAILERYYLDKSSEDINKVLDWLSTCHSNILSLFVDYVNEVLMPSSKPMWCSTKRTRSKLAISLKARVNSGRSQYNRSRSSVYCIPPPRILFRKMCLSHHIGIDVTAGMKFLTSSDVLRHNKVKIVQLTGINHTRDLCYVSDNRMLAAYRNNYLLRENNLFVMCDNIVRQSIKYCMLELYNYLDIYLDLSFVNIIWTFVYL